ERRRSVRPSRRGLQRPAPRPQLMWGRHGSSFGVGSGRWETTEASVEFPCDHPILAWMDSMAALLSYSAGILVLLGLGLSIGDMLAAKAGDEKIGLLQGEVKQQDGGQKTMARPAGRQ